MRLNNSTSIWSRIREWRWNSTGCPQCFLFRTPEPWGGHVVFPNDRGDMYTKNGKLEDTLRDALAAIGHRRIRLHDLRHVYASHFVTMAGGSVYDLQKNLGHHSVAFTAEIYGHLSADHRVQEADRLSFDAPIATQGIVIDFAKPARATTKHRTLPQERLSLAPLIHSGKPRHGGASRSSV